MHVPTLITHDCANTYQSDCYSYIPSWKHLSSRKNTEIKQLGPWLALGWATMQGLDVDAVATNK